MIVTLATPPVSASLITLANVKTEILVSGSDHDTYLTSLIAEANETITGWAGRPLHRAQWTETNLGNSLSTFGLSRYPIASLDTVTYDGGAITTLKIQSRDGGLLRYPGSSFSTIGEPDEWSFTYTAGWFTTGDDYTGTVSVDATDDSFNSSASDFHRLLRAGDVVLAGGFTNSVNNGYHRVVTATTAKITTASSLTTEASASGRTFGLRNLLGWIERAALDLVRIAYFARDRDPSIRSIGLGPASVSYDYGAEAQSIRTRIERLAL